MKYFKVLAIFFGGFFFSYCGSDSYDIAGKSSVATSEESFSSTDSSSTVDSLGDTVVIDTDSITDSRVGLNDSIYIISLHDSMVVEYSYSLSGNPYSAERTFYLDSIFEVRENRFLIKKRSLRFEYPEIEQLGNIDADSLRILIVERGAHSTVEVYYDGDSLNVIEGSLSRYLTRKKFPTSVFRPAILNDSDTIMVFEDVIAANITKTYIFGLGLYSHRIYTPERHSHDTTRAFRVNKINGQSISYSFIEQE